MLGTVCKLFLIFTIMLRVYSFSKFLYMWQMQGTGVVMVSKHTAFPLVEITP